jgi:ABC-type transporter Mla MlaB component
MAAKRKSGALIELPERFTVEAVADVLDEIRSRSGRAKTIRFDASAVGTADSAGLQLLAAARRDLEAAGKAFELESVPDAMADSARLLGLAPMLNLQ